MSDLMTHISTVVTQRGAVRSAVALEAPAGLVSLVALRPWQIVLIRASRVYLQSFVGFMLATQSGAGLQLGMPLPAAGFWREVMACAGLALAPAVMSLLQNTIELLTRVDETLPQLRG